MASGADRPGLERLLRPQSIAVIGGGAWCANVIGQCLRIGFEGDIWPVHPRRSHVAGVPAMARIEDMPSVPDAVFMGINRDATIEAVRSLARRGAGGAVCFASGFREAQAELTDGIEKQNALLEAAGGMTVLGPNCYGFVNYLDGVALWPDQHGGARVDSGVAIISQSSNIAINLTMQMRGLPLAYMVTVGNQAQTGMAQIALHLLLDSRVTALGLYIEGFGDLRAWEAVSHRARALGKPIVALKVGRSAQARAATLSHTASLAGSAAGARAALDRLGIAAVSGLPALIETLKLLHVAGPLPSNRIATLSSSGGEASLIADAALSADVTLPDLGAEQQGALRAALGSRVALANPLDYHTYIWGDVAAMRQCFAAMMLGDLALGCIILDFPRADRCDPADWDLVIEAIAQAQWHSGRQMAVLATLPECLPEATANRLIGLGIVPLVGIAEALEAIGLAAGLGRPRAPVVPILRPLVPKGRRIRTEREAKAILSRFGIPVPSGMPASSPRQAGQVAEGLRWPVVLKGSGVAHKTEAGAVALDLWTPQQVEQAASAMVCDGFLVEEMVTDAVAELLVGVICDPPHGYVLTVAAGGVWAELFEDRVSLLVPASRSQVGAAVLGLRMAPVLRGYRGRPAADMEAILDAIMALQACVADLHPHEIEINPLLCTPGGAVAADALLVTGE